jgi:Aminoglycoside/hydroxyurea antibiotic resistance kinase
VDSAARLGACKRRWDLQGGSRLGGGFRSDVFACSAAGGEQEVVKLTATPEEARLEAAALTLWAHTRAAVRLIDADITHGALLLQRIWPGTPLPGGGQMGLNRQRALRWAAVWAVLQTCQAWRDDQSDLEACLSSDQFEHLLAQ